MDPTILPGGPLLADSATTALIGGVAAVLGAGAGAIATGITTARTARSDRRAKWLQFKRGNSRKFLQHIAVHRRDGELSEEDERLVGHYYLMALAVAEDGAATRLYEALPEELRARVHDPRESPLKELRSEVTPERHSLGPAEGNSA